MNGGMALDIRTMMLALTLMIGAGAMTLALVQRSHRALRGVGTLAIGMGMLATGVLLITARGGIPLWVSIIVANALIQTAYVVNWRGIRRLIGAEPLSPVFFAIPLVVAAAIAYYWDDAAALGLRMGFGQTSAGVLYLLQGMDLTRRWRSGGLGQRLLGAGLLIHGGFLLIAGIAAFLSDAGGDIHAGSPFRAMLVLEGFAAAVILVAAIFLTINDRLIGELNLQATIDPLTEAYNRRAFYMIAEKDMSRFARRGGDMAVLVIDLDRFKQLNDAHGHAAGDEALRHFVAIARRVLRGNDVFARFGGEEFIALLPETGPAEAEAVAERLRMAVETSPVAVDGKTIPLTISIGIGSFAGPGVTLDETIRAADAALYRAKAGGRNRIERETSNRL